MAFNHDLFDSFTVRATDLQKLTASQRMKAIQFLKKLEQDLVVELARADLPGYQMLAYREARLRALLESTKATIQRSYDDIAASQRADFRILADAEQQFVMKSINDLAGIDLATTALTTEQLNALVSDNMIAGSPTTEWWSRQAAGVAQKFADTVRLGVAKGQSNSEITAAVRSGATDIAVKNADILVRTSVQAISTETRLQSFEANDDVIEAIQQHSTLDGRTTLICIAYSGQRWTNDEEHKALDVLPFLNDGGSITGIPRHWGCRSYFMPVTKSWAAMGAKGLKTGGRPAIDIDAYFKQRLKARGLTDDQIAATIRNSQASMDGQVPEAMNYEQWLKTKPEAFQREQLGPTRFRLWKAGKLNFTDLVDRSGDPMTVEELLKKTA